MTELLRNATHMMAAPAAWLPGLAAGDFRARRLLSDLLHILRFMVIGLAVLWAIFLRPVALGGATTYVRVHGASMEPTLYGGDMAIVREQPAYALGEVVAFAAEGGMVIHRIVGGSPVEGFVTRGDSRDADDAWRPGEDLIAGSLWITIPHAGLLADRLQQPRIFGAFTGILALFVLSGFLRVPRRRPRGHSTVPTVPHPRPQVPARILLLAAMTIATGLLTAGLVVALRRDGSTVRVSTPRAYGHHAGYTYTAIMTPSSLYPQGRLGPVPPGASPAQGAPLFAKLTHRLDLGLMYVFDGADGPPVHLEYSATFRVEGGKDGWSRETQLLEPRSLDGPRLFVPLQVDLDAIGELLTAVETETGFRPEAYTISVIPRIRVTAQSHGVTVDEVFTPAFTIKHTPTVLTLEQTGIQTAAGTRTAVAVTNHGYRLGPLHLTLADAQRAFAASVVVMAVASIATAVVVLRPILADESRRIAARYGTLLVEVTNVDPLPARSIRVVSIEDLARVAQRESLAICHVAPKGLYFVQSASARFEYLIRSRCRAADVTPFAGPADGVARSA